MTIMAPNRETSLVQTPPSPLLLCDRLIGLAKDADRAGCTATAHRLVALLDTIFDEPHGNA